MTAIEFNYQLIQLQSGLKNFAWSLTMNRDDAKDLLQDTLLKALKYRNKFVDPTNLKAWLYTIMKNTFINSYRRKIKANTVIDGTKDLYYVNSSSSKGEISPESKYNQNEIEQIIKGLEEEYRIPFTMYFSGFKYQEIAEKLALPIGTVKSRIFLARRKLMEALKDYA